MRIASINLNGIRAAKKRGFVEWLEADHPDVLLMQEIRAEVQITEEILGPDWAFALEPSRIKGRAGVGVAVQRTAGEILDVRHGLDAKESDRDSGRWVETLVRPTGSSETLRLVSAYFHSGEIGTQKQDAKMAHLPRIGARLADVLALSKKGDQALVCGDFNVVRSRADIKNWTPNHNKRAGVLDEEIHFLNAWVDEGWRDVVRDLAGEVQGPYSWWSWRGKAFDNDAGWRIDYHYATPGLADRAQCFTIGRADSYDARFSDHAPVTIDYAI